MAKNTINVVAIHDPYTDDLDYMVYLFKYSTMHGTYQGQVKAEAGNLVIDGRVIKVLSKLDKSKIPWKEMLVEYVWEASKTLKTLEEASAHIEAGAKKVILLSHPVGSPTYAMGVNEEQYDPSVSIISAASCSTNCLALLAKVVNDTFGITEGLATVLHAYSGTQNVVDSVGTKDWRYGRSGTQNIIPALTNSANGVSTVIPALAGKLTATCFRVPSTCVSAVELTCYLKTSVNYDEIKSAIQAAAFGPLKNYLGYTEDMVVSSDFIGDSRSCIFDANAGIALSPTFVKLISWCDHEWSHANRVVDLISYMYERDHSLHNLDSDQKRRRVCQIIGPNV